MRVGRAQLLARIGAAAFAAQPLAVQQVGAGELRADAGPAQVRDRLPVKALGLLAFCSAARANAPRPPAPSRVPLALVISVIQ